MQNLQISGIRNQINLSLAQYNLIRFRAILSPLFIGILCLMFMHPFPYLAMLIVFVVWVFSAVIVLNGSLKTAIAQFSQDSPR